MDKATPVHEPLPSGPGWLRAWLVIGGLVAAIGWLGHRSDTGDDPHLAELGRIEVTARLVKCPDEFPNAGAYRYTYVLEYEVIEVHRPDPAGKYPLAPGDHIFVGHYKPWMPRAEIRDADWDGSPLGGKLAQFTAGDRHRMALDYELQQLAPSGVMDYCDRPGSNRFFALWTNPR